MNDFKEKINPVKDWSTLSISDTIITCQLHTVKKHIFSKSDQYGTQSSQIGNGVVFAFAKNNQWLILQKKSMQCVYCDS